MTEDIEDTQNLLSAAQLGQVSQNLEPLHEPKKVVLRKPKSRQQLKEEAEVKQREDELNQKKLEDAKLQ